MGAEDSDAGSPERQSKYWTQGDPDASPSGREDAGSPGVNPSTGHKSIVKDCRENCNKSIVKDDRENCNKKIVMDGRENWHNRIVMDGRENWHNRIVMDCREQFQNSKPGAQGVNPSTGHTNILMGCSEN